MVSIRRLLQVPPLTSILLLGFHHVCLLFYKKYFINLRLLLSGYLRKLMHCRRNKIFPFSSLMVGFDFAVLFMCIFYDSFFYSFAIMKYESRAVVVFSDSEKTKFEVDTTSIILSYLSHFGNVNKELLRYC